MDDLEPVWIETRRTDGERHSSNPYVDLIEGTKPQEIVEFELNMNPYARVLPNNSHVFAASRSGHHGEAPRRISPIVLVISLILLILVVAGGVHIFAPHIGR